MKSISTLLLPVFYFLILPSGFAQHVPDFTCGFDHFRNAAQMHEIESFEEQLRLHLTRKKEPGAAEKSASALPYVVPVVVHIIHNGGAENIPDASILAAIDHLNQGFAAQGYFAQQGATVNSQIQFCMAKRDPDGNATNGITRTQSALTDMVMETDDIATKNLSRWDPTQYVNIWVVKEITSLSAGPGVAGYAYFPTAHGQPQDGMICEAGTFGVSAATDAVLIHEMGHYFGLYHTFQGGCPNDDCTIDGDRVCDTPPDNARHTACNYNSCQTDVAPGSPFTSDVNDFTGDFLDYSPFQCYYFFTAGQAMRMQAALEMERKSLLESKGCLEPCTQPVAAAFSATPNPVFIGDQVILTSNSTGATSFSWSQDGAEFSQSQNTTHVFSALGEYLISLEVTNSDPNCSDIAQTLIQVQCPVIADFSVDQLEISPGTSLAFTNTSGGGATNFEWSINGFALATTADFSYLFTTPGYYSIKLQAGTGACSDEKTVEIYVKSPCGNSFFAEIKYKIGLSGIGSEDMVGLPDGSIILCGNNDVHPMITRLDASGNVFWHRILNLRGGFNDIEPLPNGYFALRGQLNGLLLLAKIDSDGNILWLRTLQDTPTYSLGDQPRANALAANPDGSFVFYYKNQYTALGTIGKMSANGTLEWKKQFFDPEIIGGLQRATDGSGDFLMSRIFTASEYGVIRIDPSGNLVQYYKYALPPQGVTENSGGILPSLSVHPDGDFSLTTVFSHEFAFQSGSKYVIRCKPDGQVRWAKKIAAPGFFSTFFHTSYFPGEGWLISDHKSDENVYLIRLDEQGEILWERKIGTSGLYDNFWGETVLTAIKQNGMIRALKRLASQAEYSLLQLPDVYTPIPCLPDQPMMDEVTDAVFYHSDTSLILYTLNFVLVPQPFTFLNTTLTRTTSCALLLPCPEVCDNGLDDDDDGYVDCFDSDCPCFDPDTCVATLPPVPVSGKMKWQSKEEIVDNLSTPFIGNLNPQVDSIPEILVQNKNYPHILIFRGDGQDKDNPTVFTESYLHTMAFVPPILADINADGVPEVILIKLNGKIAVYTNYMEHQSPPLQFWFESSTAVTLPAGKMSAADFDHDGKPEIYIGNQIFSFDFSNPALPTLTNTLQGSGHKGTFPTGNNIPLTVGQSTVADILSRADCNGDPDCDGLELIAGAHIYSIDLDPADGDGLEIKIKRDLNLLAPNQNFRDGHTQIADMNLDGQPDVVVSSSRGNGIYGTYIWGKNGFISFFLSPYSLAPASGPLTIANVFDDRTAGFAQDFPEIITRHGSPVRLVTLNLNAQTQNPANPFWWRVPTDDVSNGTFVTAFDFNYDGFDEIVTRGDSSLRVVYGGPLPLPAGVDPVTRAWFKFDCAAYTQQDGPVVADVDNDGAAEIIYCGDNVAPEVGKGRLSVLESANLPWPAARPVWNQYNYYGVNINDDLTVPRTQQKHWLEMGGIGSGKRPYNTCRAQVASLNPQQSNKLKAPDVNIVLDSMRCRMDSFDLHLNICNFGSAVLPDGTPIAFYDGDPTITTATLLFPPVTISESIEKGACKSINLTVPATYNSTLYVVVNDNGTLPRPFDLMADFPSTNLPECHYENNITSFSIQHQTTTLSLGPDTTLCQSSVVELSANPGFQKYRWQDGSTESKFTAFLPGKYWVDVFDACGFRQTDTVEIKLDTLHKLDLPDEITICAGKTVHLSTSGFSGYTWWPADSVSCFNCAEVDILSKNSITVQLTASVGNCFVSDSVRLHVNPQPDLQLSAPSGSCEAPQTIIPNVSGNGPFDFNWSDLSTDSLLVASQSGAYIVNVTDRNGCSAIDSINISIGVNTLELSVSSIAPGCADAQTGSIDLIVNGGTLPLQFLWSDNVTTEDLSNVSAGTYSVLVSDANGCIDTISEILTNPLPIALTLQKTDPKCAGEASGTIDLTASGGTGNFQFLWSDNSFSEDLAQASSGAYSVLVTDANGCTSTLSETLSDPPTIVLALQKTDPACAGEASGTIDLSASGGTGNFQFLWSDNSFSEDLTQASSGTYSVLVTDANGCTSTLYETLTDPPAIVLALQKTDPKCTGESSGAIDLTASGGTGNFQFSWSDNSLSEDLTQVPAGIYSVLVTDANGCTATHSETLTDPPHLALDLQKTDLNCPGDSVFIDLTAEGGTPAFTFLWSTGAVAEDIYVLQAGSYSVSVVDLNGCEISGTVNISTLGTAPVLSLTTDTLDCQTTTAVISVASNVPNTSFLWSGAGGFSSVLATLPVSWSGTFSVIATEPSGGCTATGSVFVPIDTVSPTVILTADLIEIPCNQSTLSISAAGSSSGGRYSIQWTATAGGVILSGEQSLSPTIASIGFYDMLISDLSNGCTASAGVEVVQMEKPVSQIVADSVRCFGETNGAIQMISTSGGTPPILYSIDNQNFTSNPIFENLPAGVYPVSIRDSNGCSVTTTIEVGQPAAIAVDLTGDSLVVQGATANLQAIVQPPGFIPARIDWLANGIDLVADQLLQSVRLFENTAFQIDITDGNGCSASDTWLVRVDDQYHIYAANIISPENPSGANQVFLLYADANVVEIESLQIFDRWGNLVFANDHFYANDENEGWDGTFRGKQVQAGVFVWMAKVVLADGKVAVLEGSLTVIR